MKVTKEEDFKLYVKDGWMLADIKFISTPNICLKSQILLVKGLIWQASGYSRGLRKPYKKYTNNKEYNV